MWVHHDPVSIGAVDSNSKGSLLCCVLLHRFTLSFDARRRGFDGCSKLGFGLDDCTHTCNGNRDLPEVTSERAKHVLLALLGKCVGPAFLRAAGWSR